MSTLRLLRALAEERLILRDAQLASEAGEHVDVRAQEVAVEDALDAIFEGGEADRPVRCSYRATARVVFDPSWRVTMRTSMIRLFIEAVRAIDWLAWGGSEWPPRAIGAPSYPINIDAQVTYTSAAPREALETASVAPISIIGRTPDGPPGIAPVPMYFPDLIA